MSPNKVNETVTASHIRMASAGLRHTAAQTSGKYFTQLHASLADPHSGPIVQSIYMRQLLFIALLLSYFYRSDIAASQTATPDVIPPATVPADRPLDRLPYTPSLDVSAMDRSENACVDFYQYA